MTGGEDRSMLLMAILPIMLICTILVATVLVRRGYLGPQFRVVAVSFPLAAIAASLSLGAAAILFVHVGDALTNNWGLGLFAVVGGMFHLLFAQLYVLARSTWAAIVGAVGTVLVMHGSIVFGLLGLPIVAESAPFLGAFQLASLAAHLAQREMPVQRAVVLGSFGVATVALFTCTALVGGALPA